MGVLLQARIVRKTYRVAYVLLQPGYALVGTLQVVQVEPWINSEL